MRLAPAATPGWLRFGSGLSGAADQEVAALQTMLNAAGADIAVDGRFGPETERALARFQASAGIAVDGIAGPQTMKALTGTIAAAAQRAAAIGLAQKARMAAPPDPRDRWSRIGGAPRPVPPMKGPAAAVPDHAFPVMQPPLLKPPAVPIPAKGLHPYPLTAGGSVANPGRPAPPAKTAAPPMKPPPAWKAPPPTTLSKGKI
ncbi:MAG: peptidoglycan-binding protein [Bauldia sp.]|nr:peptidoglycan-binding protein [Bauldia sp.]